MKMKNLLATIYVVLFANQASAEELQGLTKLEFGNLNETQRSIYIQGLIDGIEAAHDWTMIWAGHAPYCVPDRSFLDSKKMDELMQKYQNEQITIGHSIITMDNIFCTNE